MRVLISGATGLIGTALSEVLSARGDEVVALCRNTTSPAAKKLEALRGVQAVSWKATGDREPWWDEIAGVQAVVNLAGEPVAGKRWSSQQRQQILNSRLDATRSLVRAIEASEQRPKVFLSASAIGYYGFRGDEVLSEDGPRGDDFLASVCYEWESAAQAVAALKVRLVVTRIGIVFASADSALQQMALPFRLFAGGPIGSGRQWVSWIHLQDVLGLMLKALDTPAIHGVLNLTAPTPVRNSELSRILGKTLGRPHFLPVPKFALQVAVGDMADILVTGQRVLPTAALAAGYSFRHPNCAEAVGALLK
jgi:hypothetical protein